MNKANVKRIQRPCHICGKLRSTEKLIEGNSICPSCYQKNYAPKRICSICNQEKIVSKKIGELNICPECYNANYRPKKICSICNEEKIIAKKVLNKNYCYSCYHKYSPKRTCSLCNEEKNTAKIVDGKSICPSCYNKIYKPKRVCSICGEIKIISKNIDDKSICSVCYNRYYRPKRICSVCNEENIIIKKINGMDICAKCYNKNYRPKRLCSICNNEDTTYKFIEGKSICRKCYNKNFLPKNPCFICGEIKPTAKIIDAKSVCSRCYEENFKPKRICSGCGELKTITKNLEDKSFCEKCYRKQYQPKRTCSVCGKEKIIAKKQSDLLICGSCYKQYATKRVCAICGSFRPTNKYVDGKSICQKCYDKSYKTPIKCSSCGTKTLAYRVVNKARICYNCYVNTNEYHIIRFNTILEDLKKNIKSKEIIDLIDKFSISLLEHRGSFYSCMILPSQYDIFLYMDKNRLAFSNITYSYLDHLEKEYGVKTSLILKNFFISENILHLPDIIELFYNYQQSLLEKIPSIYCEVFIKYSNYLIDYKKMLIKKGHTEKFKYETFKEYCTVCYKLLCFLNIYISSINELNNDLIQKFFQTNNDSPYFHQYIRRFIKWVNKSYSLFRRLSLPKCHKTEHRNTYTEEELLSIIDSLSDTDVTNRDKILCFLMLFYAIRPVELSKLKLADYKCIKDTYLLNVRNSWISIDPFIAAILDEYIKNERNFALSLGSDIEWLFFGFHYNKPLSVASICYILKKYNIAVPVAFSTAISNLFIESGFKPALLIKGLGINIYTCVDYYKSLAIDNTYYIKKNYVENKIITQQSKHFSAYILKCNDGTYYTGYTNDLQKRLQQHQNGTGCTYTRTRTPVELVYSEEFPDKPSALKREKQIKKLTIFDKEKLIEKSRAN